MLSYFCANPNVRIIHPVILEVPEKYRQIRGKEKVALLSRQAREALALSAQKTGVLLGPLLKDTNGAPLPVGGNYWSISHKQTYVGGVVSQTRIGFDIEKMRETKTAMIRKVASDAEWRLSDEAPRQRFFRYWTAKEAVLKATGRGIWGLSDCRIIDIIDKTHLIISHQQCRWTVEHFYFNNHVAAVVCDKHTVRWHLNKSHPQGR